MTRPTDLHAQAVTRSQRYRRIQGVTGQVTEVPVVAASSLMVMFVRGLSTNYPQVSFAIWVLVARQLVWV